MNKVDKYILRVKDQLYCNVTKEEHEKFGSYNYTNDQIDENKDYFKDCYERNLSPHKALLFFHYHLIGTI